MKADRSLWQKITEITNILGNMRLVSTAMTIDHINALYVSLYIAFGKNPVVQSAHDKGERTRGMTNGKAGTGSSAYSHDGAAKALPPHLMLARGMVTLGYALPFLGRQIITILAAAAKRHPARNFVRP